MNKFSRADHTYSVSGRIRNKKKDDDLIAYLNNSNEPTSSRCSSVASCFSAPNPHIASEDVFQNLIPKYL